MACPLGRLFFLNLKVFSLTNSLFKNDLLKKHSIINIFKHRVKISDLFNVQINTYPVIVEFPVKSLFVFNYAQSVIDFLFNLN